MSNCLFCDIANKKVPATIVYEDDLVVAFDDINKLAPIHILIIPKAHIASINDLKSGDAGLVGKMILAAKDIAKEKQIADSGYKLLFRTGKHGQQEVSHLHLHLIGGVQLKEDIGPA